MDPTTEQLDAFGAEARRRRKASGLTAQGVADAMTERLGRSIKTQSVRAWERGEYGPQDAATVMALDDVLGAGGELAALLSTDLDAVYARLDALEDSLSRQRAELAAQQKILRAILRRLDQGGRG